MTIKDRRIQELLDLPKAEGFTLALHPDIILAMEDAGAGVNLRTGAIVIDGEQVRYAPRAAQEPTQTRYEVVQTAQGGYVLDHTAQRAYAIVQPSYKAVD